ncbi:MAG: sensor domain-containing diguanylate cyclase, partial [Candidatus Omnitrophota bacterium]|nr:sensor domain-containing diguanylate cyclase [Candidatus Omnitrophota bacterium]
ALKQLTLRIKDNMQELKKYSEETKEINLEINRKVIALSGLLQVSSFISEGEEISEILDLSMEKMVEIGDTNLAFLLLQEGEVLLLKSAYGTGAERLLNKKFKLVENNLFAKLTREAKSFLLDNNTLKNRMVLEFEQEFGVKDAFIAPLFIHGRIAGLVGVGNNKRFAYRSDEFKLIDIFIKQIDIALENDILMHKVKNLEVKDNLTSLYNESFVRIRLDEEIKRAIIYQRPCAFVIFGIDGYEELCQNLSLPEIELILKRIAVIIRESISDIDKAAKFGEKEFAIVLPEKNKKQAQNIGETIKERIEYLFKNDPDKCKRITVSVGVAENPIDGVNGAELIAKALSSLSNT